MTLKAIVGTPSVRHLDSIDRMIRPMQFALTPRASVSSKLMRCPRPAPLVLASERRANKLVILANFDKSPKDLKKNLCMLGTYFLRFPIRSRF